MSVHNIQKQRRYIQKRQSATRQAQFYPSTFKEERILLCFAVREAGWGHAQEDGYVFEKKCYKLELRLYMAGSMFAEMKTVFLEANRNKKAAKRTE